MRRLIEHIDGAVEDAYASAGLDYRPRFTPIVRSLAEAGPATILQLARRTGFTHSATSQTVSQLARRGLVSLESGQDARERIVALTRAAEAMLPELRRLWALTQTARQSLDDDLGVSLRDVVGQALDHLERKSFAERLTDAAAT